MPEEKKSFWKKYEFVFVAIVTLAFIYGIVFFNQKINFLLGNELIVYLTPQQISLDAHYGDINKIKFNISIDNVAYCRASCSYSFNDRSRNELVENGTFEIAKKQNVVKSYNLSVKRPGSGQDIYSFDVSCRSIRTYLCLTKGDETSRSSLAVVNYDLTETEKKLKELLKQNVTELLKELRDVDMLHQQINEKYFELGFNANLQSLSKQKIAVDDIYDKIRVEIENFRSLWSIEDYVSLSKMFNESFSERLQQISLSLESLDLSIDEIIGLHNNLLLELENIYNESVELRDFVSMLEDNEIKEKFSMNQFELHDAISSLINNTFESYGTISQAADGSKKKQDSLIAETKTPATRLYFDMLYNENSDRDFLCSLDHRCNSSDTILNSIKKTENLYEKFPDSGLLKDSCASLDGLSSEYASSKSEALKNIGDKNISFPAGNQFTALAISFKDNVMRGINNSYHDSFIQIKKENNTSKDILEIAEPYLPQNNVTVIPLPFNETLNLSLYTLSRAELSEKSKKFLGDCSNLKDINDENLNFEPLSKQINFTPISRIETSLSDNPPICCIFNDCKPCCRNDSCRDDPKTFPVILLHGHSLAEGNSPEFSLDSFNSLQARLQDDGYLNAGIVSLYSKNEQLQNGVWGLSGKPVTVKVSYYYDAFRKDDKYIIVPTKSENIDTYALRLKDLIEIVKQRTNKPKVDIIAHSMGGLVARRYIQIFGGDDIDKLIMISTPNKGISGSASSYCGIIGENKECTDMKENSIFLSKLNDPSSQQTKVKQYIMIGQGCDTDGKDGDGVVAVENVRIDNSNLFYINGSCKGFFGKVLHTEILNVDEYTETYQTVKKILMG